MELRLQLRLRTTSFIVRTLVAVGVLISFPTSDQANTAREILNCGSRFGSVTLVLLLEPLLLLLPCHSTLRQVFRFNESFKLI